MFHWSWSFIVATTVSLELLTMTGTTLNKHLLNTQFKVSRTVCKPMVSKNVTANLTLQ